MKNNIKKIILSSLLVVIAFLGFIFASLLTNFSIPLIMSKASSNYALKVAGEYYDLPVYIHYCYYEYQEDVAYIIPGNDYYVESNEFDLSEINQNLDCYIEQDTYIMYGDDGLPSSFYIISSKNLKGNSKTTENYELDGTSISSILQIDGVLGIPLTKDNSNLDPFEIVEKEMDDKVPVINGYEGILNVNVDEPTSVSEIKKLIKAIDEVDGDLTDDIIIESDEYTQNNHILGTYPIVFSVTDKSGNKASLTINVKVTDISCPILEGPEEINTTISDPISNSKILQKYTATDNYDGTISDKITFYRNNYENADKTKVGSYEVILSIKDSSYNVTYKTIKINILDNIKPLISGPSEYIKDYNNPLTLSTIMDGLTATDNTDGDLTNEIRIVEDKYTGNESKLGTFNITFNVTDKSGNISNNFIVTVKVEDNKEPVFYISNIIISTHAFENLSLENIESYLIQSALINKYEDYSLNIIENEYEKNKKIPGTYKMLIRVNYSSGNEEDIKLSIFVNDNDHNLSNINSSSTIDYSFIKNIWDAITLFFINSWKWFINTIVNPIIKLFK